MFFDRQIRFVSDYNGPDFPFSCIDPLLSSADMVVGNMEGPVTNNPSVSLGTVPGSTNNYKFTFPTTTPQVLLRHNVQVVSIGNNHLLNFGYDGLAQTHHYLADAGLNYFGGVKGSEPVYQTEVQGIPLSFVGFNAFGGADPADVAKTVAQEKKDGRVVVVFSHWGTEYSTNADEMRPWATLFAASGAAAVIGAHPHVVGLREQIGSTSVYYSLGNFIFDQYFSAGVTHGLAVMLTIGKDGVVGSQEYPVVLERDGRTCLAE
jgi:poly-gamma-glutamate synthesis protein (capsule biosynthesis protein)